MDPIYLRLLKEKGHRLTKVRKTLLNCLQHATGPLSVQELLAQLAQKGIRPHKTTVYRELEFFLAQGWVEEVKIAGRSSAFEWSQGEHHHHLVCRSCDKVEDVELGASEDVLFALEREFQRVGRFSDIRHQLSFSGLCDRCS